LSLSRSPRHAAWLDRLTESRNADSKVLGSLQAASHHLPPDLLNSSTKDAMSTTSDRAQISPLSYTPTRSSFSVPSVPPEPSTSSRFFRCAIPECTYDRAFASLSDLHRHQRDVHDVHQSNDSNATGSRFYRCDVSGCTHDRGFATQTDLNRHQKGVHGIYQGNDSISYRCQGKDCNHPDKIWPRRDNFRGHLSRIHPNENVEELTERYI